ncbi:uncharacterized protein MAM_06577 [Metarhizium album ARSEF 1941]|uniref:Cyclin-like F-box n=1 Tax=Metarhizium album (strain ARSEF 1941) TaxID=1081103 RepID=A0A0B2WRB6_METAS|nr:uncharacterized protein MAM_06577 [Metarhizium album ARSEF 1941]KHN95520.1 hypothetical protein MAM_06577 [Metarhizium album ARSEF 1941]
MEPPSADPAAIVLRPIIQDLVRTRFAVPGSVFLVEGVQAAPLTQSGRWQVIRLLLGDGELCIQAVLGDAMHRFVHTREVVVGSYVCVQDFQLRLRNIDSEADQVQQMVYLVVHDLKTLGCHEGVRQMHHAAHEVRDDGSDEASREREPSPSLAPAFTRAGSACSAPGSPGSPAQPRRPPSGGPSLGVRGGGGPEAVVDVDVDVEDALDEFEALAFPVSRTQQRAPGQRAHGKPRLPVALPRDWHDVQTPLKLTTLRSVPNLPYRQNWSCNVLAIVASLSGVESSHLPPYRQRTARLTDPSTAKQVHLAVFLDPDEFTPKVGSAVLLTGVKNHRFDGGSLKKYASDRGTRAWWFEDPYELAWCDIRGIKDWWAEMEAYFASQLSEEVIGGDA